jgi:hypothetical protein
VLEQAESHPQRTFVTNALALCVRLSYWERIQQVIPEEFLQLMPHQPHPAFRFSAKNIQNTNGDLNIQQYHQLSQELMKALAGKSQPNAIIGWLDAQVTPVLGAEARFEYTPHTHARNMHKHTLTTQWRCLCFRSLSSSVCLFLSCCVGQSSSVHTLLVGKRQQVLFSHDRLAGSLQDRLPSHEQHHLQEAIRGGGGGRSG